MTIATAGGHFAKRNIPFVVAHPVVDRTIRISFVQPTEHGANRSFDCMNAIAARRPASVHFAVAVDKLHEFNIGSDFPQAPKPGIAGSRCRKGKRRGQLHDVKPRSLCAHMHRAIRLNLNRHRPTCRGPGYGSEALFQPLALISADCHHAKCIGVLHWHRQSLCKRGA